MNGSCQWMEELQSGLKCLAHRRPEDCLAAMEALILRYPNDTLCLAMAKDGMGKALFAMQCLDDAFKALEESLALLLVSVGEDSALTTGAMQNLAHAYLAQNRIEESIALGREAVRINEKAFGEGASQVAGALLRLSAAYYRQKDFAEAEALMLQAKEIWEKQDGFVPELGTCLNNLGRICEERGEFDKGIALHRKAVALRQELLGEHEDTAFSLGNLGVALASAGHWSEAARTLQDSVNCYASLGLSDSPEAAGYFNNLQICLQAMQGS